MQNFFGSLKRTFFILLIISFASCNEIFGQENFQSGFVITNEKDTIYGQILNRIDAKLALEISFIDDIPESKVLKYTVSDLIGFAFDNGRTFERVYIENATDSLSSVFAKKILTGRIDMLIWRHSKGPNDIFLRNNNDGKFVHITKPTDKIISKDGNEYKQKDLKFVGLINYVTNNKIGLLI